MNYKGKCFIVDYKDDGTIYVIGQKVKGKKFEYGSVKVDNNDNVIFIHLRKKKNDAISAIEKNKIIQEWIKSHDFVITDNTETMVKTNSFDKSCKSFVTKYLPIDDWIKNNEESCRFDLDFIG